MHTAKCDRWFYASLVCIPQSAIDTFMRHIRAYMIPRSRRVGMWWPVVECPLSLQLRSPFSDVRKAARKCLFLVPSQSPTCTISTCVWLTGMPSCMVETLQVNLPPLTSTSSLEPTDSSLNMYTHRLTLNQVPMLTLYEKELSALAGTTKPDEY